MSFIGQGSIVSRTGTKIVTTEKMAGIKSGVYVVKVMNSDGKLSSGVDLTIT